MTLQSLLEQVRDDKLSLSQCEALRDQMVHLLSRYYLRAAELKKLEALFFLEHKEDSAVRVKYQWRATKEGSELIDTEAAIKALVKECDSLRSRIFSQLGRV